MRLILLSGQRFQAAEAIWLAIQSVISFRVDEGSKSRLRLVVASIAHYRMRSLISQTKLQICKSKGKWLWTGPCGIPSIALI